MRVRARLNIAGINRLVAIVQNEREQHAQQIRAYEEQLERERAEHTLQLESERAEHSQQIKALKQKLESERAEHDAELCRLKDKIARLESELAENDERLNQFLSQQSFASSASSQSNISFEARKMIQDNRMKFTGFFLYLCE